MNTIGACADGVFCRTSEPQSTGFMMIAIGIQWFALLLVATATADVLSRRIPNHLTILIFASFPLVALAAGMPSDVILVHACVGFALLALGFLLFSSNLLGGGDAKLLAAAGLWLGLDGLPAFLTMTVLAGGLLALAVLVWSLIVFDSELRGSHMSRRIGWLKPGVPYGYAIAAGALLAFSESWWGRAFTQ